MSEHCFICGEDNPNRLQTHHAVPKRHGGSDQEENLVRLCAGCHQAVERIYDKSFFERLGVETADETEQGTEDNSDEGDDEGEEISDELRDIVHHARDSKRYAASEYERLAGTELMENDSLLSEMGFGEQVGYLLGVYDVLYNTERQIVKAELDDETADPASFTEGLAWEFDPSDHQDDPQGQQEDEGSELDSDAVPI